MVSGRPPLCKRFFQAIAYNFSLSLFSFFFFFPPVFLGRRICLVCFLVSLWFQGGFPMSISSVVEQFQDNCRGKVRFIQMLLKHT